MNENCDHGHRDVRGVVQASDVGFRNWVYVLFGPIAYVLGRSMDSISFCVDFSTSLRILRLPDLQELEPIFRDFQEFIAISEAKRFKKNECDAWTY